MERALSYYEDGPSLSGVVLDALRAAGRDVERLDPDDLASLDEFHGLGRAATLALADLAESCPASACSTSAPASAGRHARWLGYAAFG